MAAPNPDDLAERAAIVEEGAVVSAEWAEGLARLDAMPCPSGVPRERWRQVIDDAGRFLERWGGKAAVLGWRPLDVFGFDPGAPDVRMDRAGLAWLIEGRPIDAIGPDWVTIGVRRRGRLTYQRHDPSEPGRAVFWNRTE
ncbi:MAG: hypothetical protein WD673_13455 [Alphaproteobacteria bacterium]